jgi:tRNA G18 (ribose-2'-O)-methylase SpoU
VISASLDEVSVFVEGRGGEIWGADAAGDAVGMAAPPKILALAVGNEGAGLSSSVRERVARFVSLPISASVESLNVAVAAGILLYELRK